MFTLISRLVERAKSLEELVSDDNLFVYKLTPEDAAFLYIQLTKREQEVASLYVSSIKIYEIAKRLGISPNTVKSHIKNIHRKLGTHSVDQVKFIFAMGNKFDITKYLVSLFPNPPRHL